MKPQPPGGEFRPYPYLPDLDGADLREYLGRLDARARRGLDRGPAVALARRVMSPAARDWVKLNATVLAAPSARRRARRMLESGGPIRLNLGSGPLPIEGWTSVDIFGMGADVTWDLRRGVPFRDESVDAVFLEHVLEHFRIEDVLDVLVECRRVLVPGGIVRIGVPDFGRYMESYAGAPDFIESVRPGRPTRLLAVAEVALRHGHRSVWDGATLEAVLTEAGFVDARRRSFRDSDLDPPPDTPEREPETVYAEARKASAAAR